MFSLLRNRFGIPGVIAVVALVFAMLGGAYAANNSGGRKATASAKGKPGPRGPRGKQGATGPQGPAGSQGPAGPAGANGKDGAAGANGKDGTPGKDGKNGKSVEVEEIELEEAECGGLGGALVKQEGATEGVEVCNGSPWTVGGTLPVGATETGTWVVAKAGVAVNASISFTIPLEEALEDTKVHYINPAGEEVRLEGEEIEEGVFENEELVFSTSTVCLGSVANPTAVSGNLCVYAKDSNNPQANSEDIFDPDSGFQGEPHKGGAGVSGAIFRLGFETFKGSGTWAVTG
jgi:hypothetical protein